MQSNTHIQSTKNKAPQEFPRDLRCHYQKPEIVTYAEDEVLAILGPAQAQYSKPDAGDGGGFL